LLQKLGCEFIEFRFERCFLCFGGRFPFVGMTRVAAGAIPDFRAARRASVPWSKIFFVFSSQLQPGF